MSVIEPYASPISERMAALKKAHKLGLRTYGMLCPLLPGIADAPEQIDELVRFVAECGAEEVFSRGGQCPWQQPDTDRAGASGQGGFLAEAEAISTDPQTKGMVHIRCQSVGEHPAGDAEAHDDREVAVPVVSLGADRPGPASHPEEGCGRRLVVTRSNILVKRA